MKTELIERFFQRQCTSEEAEKVAAYLKTNPAILEKYLSEHEWNLTEPNENLPEEYWNEVWMNIQKKKKAKLFSLYIKRSVAAACIVSLIAFGYYLLLPTPTTTKEVEAKISVPTYKLNAVENTTNKVMTIVLQDSSIVKLSPASSIKYTIPFQTNKRDVWLDGEAYFHVAKNKAKPFTVYAEALATTALGTSFTVKANKENKRITVKLYTGKVVIHSINNLKGWNKNIYLLPGEQMRFDEVKLMLAVNKINNKPTLITNAKKQTETANNNLLTFNNAMLPEVLDKLSTYYKVKIAYDKSLLDTISFTGNVSKTDSLNIILKAIAQMNNLEVNSNNDEFIISKPQQQ